MNHKYDNQNDVHRGIINDIQCVARGLGAATLTIQNYNLYGGQFSLSSITEHFGSWNKAVLAAGLKVIHLRNITKTQMLAEIRRVAKSLRVSGLGCKQYRRAGGRIHDQTIALRFGGWGNAVAAAGLGDWIRPRLAGPRRTVPQIIEDIQRIARALNIQTLTFDQYKKAGGRISGITISKRVGSWTKAIKLASLQPYKQIKIGPGLPGLPLSDLVADLKRVARKLNTRTLFGLQYVANGGRVTHGTIAKRFGSWNKALKAAGLELSTRRPLEEFTADLARIARKCGQRTVQPLEYATRGGRFNYYTIRLRFGSWSAALVAAGLDPSKRLG